MHSDKNEPGPKYPTITPRARVRPEVIVRPIVGADADNANRTASAKNADRNGQVPGTTRPYAVGYKKPPVDTRFKEGNRGGPGRPKGSKSHDTLLRAELSTKQMVRSGGRDRQVSKRELAATLFVNTALEKRDYKMLAAINAEARRLYPEVVAEAGAQEAYDPALDRQVLRQLMQHLTLGEANPDSADPLRDLASGDPDLGQAGEHDPWNEGDWNAADDEEASDEER